MDIKIIDKNEKAKWYLGKISLWDYLESLNLNSFEYDIQRGIVHNQYLDTILKSIADNNVLQPFTIVTRQAKFVDYIASFQSFDILDGLQRTFRLWIYKFISTYSLDNDIDNAKDALVQIRKHMEVDSQVISIPQIKLLFSRKSKINVWNLRDIYSNYYIYVYLWKGLSEDEIIKKMLILNAGQKRVSLSHQYELMYLRFFKSIESELDEHIRFVRFKSRDFKKVAKGDRTPGVYLQPTAIIALQSMISGKAVRLESNMVNLDDDEYIKEDNLEYFFSKPFVKEFYQLLYKLDLCVCGDNEDINKWFVKDTTMSGILGGIGCCAREQYKEDNRFFEESNRLFDSYISQIANKANPFDVKGFYENYANLSSVRVNIGALVRKIILDYTVALLKNQPVDWKTCFEKYSK